MKKPKVVYDPRMPRLAQPDNRLGAGAFEVAKSGGSAAIDAVKATAPAIIYADVDPVILESRASLGPFRALLKLAKKAEKPLSRG